VLDKVSAATREVLIEASAFRTPNLGVVSLRTIMPNIYFLLYLFFFIDCIFIILFIILLLVRSILNMLIAARFTTSILIVLLVIPSLFVRVDRD
jgi:hypothetical protein